MYDVKHMITVQPDIDFELLLIRAFGEQNFHGTLAYFLGSGFTQREIVDLYSMSPNLLITPIPCVTTKYDRFHNGSQVLRFEASDKVPGGDVDTLDFFHRAYLSAAKIVADSAFLRKTTDKFYLDKFNPHFTIGDLDTPKEEDSSLLGVEFTLVQIVMSVKENGEWVPFFGTPLPEGYQAYAGCQLLEYYEEVNQ